MKVNVFFPFLTFFSAGEVRLGVTMLLMQLSLVLWPEAVRRARDFAQARGMQRMLDEFSQAYGRDETPPNKRFRQAQAG
jgi:hypothetical protein